MVDVIARSELLQHKALDTFCGPELSGVAGVLRTRHEQLEKRSALTVSQLRWTARSWLPLQAGRSLLLRRLEPLTDGSAADTELTCDVSLGGALAGQREGFESSVFERGGISSRNHDERLLQEETVVKSIMRQSVVRNHLAMTHGSR